MPLWVFYRGDPIDDVRGLKGRRLAVGGAESGTHALALTLLGATGADKPPTELLPLDREAAIEKLKAGLLDAVFLVAPAEAPSLAEGQLPLPAEDPDVRPVVVGRLLYQRGVLRVQEAVPLPRP